MKGRIMMARMIDAARMPDPFGTPWNRASRKDPGGAADIRGSSTNCEKKGANTNRPHMP